MAENNMEIDCPPTPTLEHVGQCPPTPPPKNPNKRIRDLLQMHLKTAAAEAAGTGSDSDGEPRRESSASPPPNCAICLGKINSKCFTDSCMHQFCFSCLLEWSKVKPECPLCKQLFKSIIHNVTSMDKYDEYKVDAFRNCSNWVSIANQFEQFLIESTMPRLRRQYSTGFMQNLIDDNNSSNTTNRHFQRLFLHTSPAVTRFINLHSNEPIPSRSHVQLWRAYVYTHDLYAVPLYDVTGRSRNISAEFYRENPAQLHRLIPWINREILYLLVPSEEFMGFALETIEDHLKTYDMVSEEFRRRLVGLFRVYTIHFIHELINFARSPYDMIGYDEMVQYEPSFTDQLAHRNNYYASDTLDDRQVEIVDSDDTIDSMASFHLTDDNVTLDVDFPLICDVYPNSGSSRRTTADASAAGSSRATGGRAAGGSSSSSNSRYTRPHASSSRHARENNSVIVYGPDTITENGRLPSATATTQEPVSIDSDDSDECLFVLEQKPPHLRTPEMVELNSDTDSDVMFIKEEAVKIEPIVLPTYSPRSDDLNLDYLPIHPPQTLLRKKKNPRKSNTDTGCPSTKQPKIKPRNATSTITSAIASTSTAAASPLATEMRLPKQEPQTEEPVAPISVIKKRYAKPVLRKSLANLSKRTRTIYSDSSSESDDSSSTSSSSSESSKNIDSSSSSSESSHEEYSILKPAGSKRTIKKRKNKIKSLKKSKLSTSPPLKPKRKTRKHKKKPIVTKKILTRLPKRSKVFFNSSRSSSPPSTALAQPPATATTTATQPSSPIILTLSKIPMFAASKPPSSPSSSSSSSTSSSSSSSASSSSSEDSSSESHI